MKIQSPGRTEGTAYREVLTTTEVGKYCGVNFRTVIRWIERGHLKAYRLPGRGDHRIEVADFLNFLQSNQIPIPEEFQPRERSVLIVEDCVEMATAMKRVLAKENYEVTLAHDGLQAGVLLATKKPSIMTLDLCLPGLSGEKVIEFVRHTEGLENTRILIVSALPVEDLERAKQKGAQDYLQKPFLNEILLEKVSIIAKVEAF
jgi:two-component system, OmpR family, response regulator VicR